MLDRSLILPTATRIASPQLASLRGELKRHFPKFSDDVRRLQGRMLESLRFEAAPVHVHIYIYIHIHIYIYMYVCMYVYVCMYPSVYACEHHARACIMLAFSILSYLCAHDSRSCFAWPHGRAGKQ